MPEFRGRVHLLLEGQTEETAAQDVLVPHFEAAGWSVSYSIIVTKRPARGGAHRGGVSSWAALEKEIRLLLKDTSITTLTTLVDYYGLPAGCPGMGDRPAGAPDVRVRHVEAAVGAAIGDARFVPHLVLHEFEAWVFAAADELAALRGRPDLGALLRADSVSAGGPELVNDGVATAPSKRLATYCPDYMKPVEGPLAVAELGLPRLRVQCPHLDGWLRDLGV